MNKAAKRETGKRRSRKFNHREMRTKKYLPAIATLLICGKTDLKKDEKKKHCFVFEAEMYQTSKGP